MKKVLWAVCFFSSSLLCAAPTMEGSFSWWMLPEYTAELPHEIEEDESQNWTEMWYRPDGDTSTAPLMVMEQGLGVRWTGTEFDSEGRPQQAFLVLGGDKIVHISKDKFRTGSLSNDGAKISWSDGTTQDAVDFKTRRRRGRRSRGRKSTIKFGKIVLPPTVASLSTELNPWSMESLPRFLETLKSGPLVHASIDLRAISQLEDQNGSVLGFRYGDSCKTETRNQLEKIISQFVEPRLTCVAAQDKELAQKLFAIFLQRPVLECKSMRPMTSAQCGMATLPLHGPFFLSRPRIALDMRESCRAEGLEDLILHEIFHLAGARDNPSEKLDKYTELSESCKSSPLKLSFDNSEREEFYNSSQVETRLMLFRKVRDESVAKWGWRAFERDFVLGTLCSHMGDRSCSRKFFEQAASAPFSGMVELPEGTSVSWSALSQYLLFDETTEDTFRMRTRMHELSKYLKRDPKGVLLQRNEMAGTRVHEYFLVRNALEKVKENKNICDDNTDERVYCEDLSSIGQSSWFRF